MAQIKPEMDLGTAQAFLENALNGSISEMRPIEQGEVSKVFSYRHCGKEFVVHFNSSKEGFDRERYVYETFSTQGIPIPRVTKVGTAGELFYSIAERIPGRPIVSYHESVVRKILPEIVEQFKRINRVKLGESKGYGWVQPSGDGTHDSWLAFLKSFFEEEQSGFWNGWYTLFEHSFLERDVFEDLYTVMMDLAKCSPEQRYLLHGDFHLGNILTDECAVTGIVDWEMAHYGDFVFDLAAQHIWTPHLHIPQMVRDALTSEGCDIPKFEERLRCALLFKGLDGLRFYAKKGDRNAYDSVKYKLLALTE